jgi:hypothetical protein
VLADPPSQPPTGYLVADLALGSRILGSQSCGVGPGCLLSVFRRPRLTAGTSRSVMSWVNRLTKTEHLRKSWFPAATGRRAVEHPPQPGFRRRRGFALSVVNVEPSSNTASLGDEGVKGRLAL